jgi:alkylation response protein AidB-like acyl-CoA dehydrogenase
MEPLKQYRLAEKLEQALGDPRLSDSWMSFAQMAALDESEAFPHEQIQWLYDWKLQHHYVPTDCGGEFTSFEEFVAFVRVLSRRDLNVAIAFTTLFWSFLTWMAGTEAQKQKLAHFIKEEHGAMCLAYSERDHGSDLVGGKVTATKVEGGYLLNGEKWPINRATISGVTFVLARTSMEDSNRGLSLFMVDKRELNPEQFYNLPKIKTHGIRCADMSGIGFNDCFVPDEMRLGQEGQGLELALKGFQITRTLCAAFSQGAADTCLRTTLNFAINRQLYGKTVMDLPHAKRTLTNAFLDILICDCVNIGASRGFHVAPSQFAVWSAVDKYFVPVTLERMMQDVSVVLGARFYMRDEHEAGAFQKMLRDSSIISVFDGSSVVNLHALILQRRQLAKARARRKPEAQAKLEARLATSFSLAQDLPKFEPTQLDLMSRGADDVLQGLELALASLAELRTDPSVDQAVLSRLEIFGQIILDELNEQDAALAQATFEHGHDQSYESFELAKQYCQLHAATACLHMWLYNRQRLGDFFAQGEWLVLALHRLLNTFKRSLDPVQESAYDTVASVLLKLYEEDKMFSIVPFQLAQSSNPIQESTSHATTPELQLR